MKPQLQRERFQDFKGILSFFIATALGSGLLPLAPGTWGSLVALPFAWWSSSLPLGVRVTLCLGILVVGTWSAHEWEKRASGGSDDQRIVIDEVLGIFVTSLILGRESGWISWIAAFVLFRLFDIVKPPPVRAIDAWSKKRTMDTNSGASSGTLLRSASSSWKGAFGVLADDFAAGIQALILLVILIHFGLLPA